MSSSAAPSSSAKGSTGRFGRSWNPLKFHRTNRAADGLVGNGGAANGCEGSEAVMPTLLPVGVRRNDSLLGGSCGGTSGTGGGKRKVKLLRGLKGKSAPPSTDLLLGRDLSNAADSQIMAGIQAALPDQTAGRNLFGRAKRHRCRFCSKGFVTPSKLQRHERIHTGDKPFGCDCCSQRFTQRCGLKVHTQLHARELMVASDMPAPSKLATKINGFVVGELVQAMQRTADSRSSTHVGGGAGTVDA
jgi:hypothetical protein